MSRRTFWLFLTMLPAFAYAADLPTITVHLYDLAGAPNGILDQAIDTTNHLYAGTGVELKWDRQTASIAKPGEGNSFRPSATPSEVSVRLLPKELSDGLVRSGSAKLGFVYPSVDNGYRYLATVLYDRVGRAARELYDIPLPQLLGYIMAHEVGHLLLGPNAHARGTLMACPWDTDEFRFVKRDQLRFNQKQTAQLRSQASARIEAATSRLKAEAARPIPPGN
ncbi:MAG: hypothetical protein IT165_01915 [Bryobacterales bacterium]|nr:hypothetical protein [Bryobacterales bacterium]